MLVVAVTLVATGVVGLVFVLVALVCTALMALMKHGTHANRQGAALTANRQGNTSATEPVRRHRLAVAGGGAVPAPRVPVADAEPRHSKTTTQHDNTAGRHRTIASD